MNCKFCQAELEPNSSVCPECGKDNLKDSLKGLKITALVLACALMLTVLVGLVYCGVTGNSFFGIGGGKNTVTYQVTTADGVITMTGKELEESMDVVAVTMGEHTMTNRELQLYFWMAAYSYGDGVDFTQPLDEQIYDEETGQTCEEYFLEMGIGAWQEITLMAAAAKEAGYEMPETYKEYVDGLRAEVEQMVATYQYYGYDIGSVDEYVQMQFGPGCDFQTYYDYTYNYYLGGLYWTEMMDNLEVTDAELEEYFAENETSLAEDYTFSITKDSGELVDLRVLTVALVTEEVEDEKGNKTTVESWDATLEKIEELYDQYMAGEKTEASFEALVKENTTDTGTISGGKYTDLFKLALAEVDVRHILIQPEGGEKDEEGNTVYTEEAWADAYAEAEAILNEWLSGEMTEETFSALAKEYSDDSGSISAGGLYLNVYKGKMVEEFDAWCFDSSRQEGDYDIIKTQHGYHIMYYVHGDREMDNWAFEEGRQVGDVTYVKTDTGYVMMYYAGTETAWIRYSRYGVQAERSTEMLEQLLADNAYTLDETKMVLAVVE